MEDHILFYFDPKKYPFLKIYHRHLVKWRKKTYVARRHLMKDVFRADFLLNI